MILLLGRALKESGAEMSLVVTPQDEIVDSSKPRRHHEETSAVIQNSFDKPYWLNFVRGIQLAASDGGEEFRTDISVTRGQHALRRDWC